MKKLLFNLLILIALLNSSYSFSNGQYNADAAALTRSASDNGLALNQSTRGLVNKLGAYQAKDAIYLPTGGLFLFEDQRSGLTIVTTTGRYSFSEGKAYDVIRKTQIQTIADIRKSYFLPMSEAPFRTEDSFTIQFGNPSLKRQAVIFITLDCADCVAFLGKMNEIKKDVRFDIVILPSPGGAAKRVKQMWCSVKAGKVTNYDILQSLLGKTNDINTRLIPHESLTDCSVEPIITSLYLASIYNVQGTPSVVREDGLLGNGIPTDFKAWLKVNLQPLLQNPFDK
ncbi:DsbC family protein [Klebsiella quasipneumoniae]|uniref:DsbC family protein n=1 Tax=Klebsiella quasipneumoniae TaxID=1463165 RepID=UPI0024C3D229|nr:DsbC family protein [Klebsiella quasipneumoniae]MDK1350710.1 DsbC family protein [Klebsiella quasipneumoniae]MDK1366611.1 DsbC family protein [Klebsiella quasipneumoniae]MDK1371804.1 DsbC family protein [Klebsiella quasipneumoniae]MDK1402951.1 DsbC family protein [Klebsiella quasipneumoniae]MDK1409921.1 DsbC family protein [Klebsiella quasipneumoniae]